MEDEDWRVLKVNDIGVHRLELVALKVDGQEHFEIVLDCVVQAIGTRKGMEGKWRWWVRALNKITRSRERGTLAKGEAK